jgi:hypothetical protein
MLADDENDELIPLEEAKMQQKYNLPGKKGGHIF